MESNWSQKITLYNELAVPDTFWPVKSRIIHLNLTEHIREGCVAYNLPNISHIH